MIKLVKRKRIILCNLILTFLIASSLKAQISKPTFVNQNNPITFNYNAQGSLVKRVRINLFTIFKYANITLKVGNKVILDNLDISYYGQHSLNAVVKFPRTGNLPITIVARGGNFTISDLKFEDTGIQYPNFLDISNAINIPKGVGLKYAGPTVADYDNDGDYDIFLNNHNDVYSPSVYVKNNGDGTFSKNPIKFSRFNKQDLHGSSLGDYDNDGDLDLISVQGGGNGTFASLPDFFKNNNGNLVRKENKEPGLTTGHRGRTAVWGDYDMDNDLDLILFNAHWKNPDPKGGKNGAYINLGNGKFKALNVPNLMHANGDRFLMTDLNRDGIDDFLIFFPLSVWIGDGKFGFSNQTNKWVPKGIRDAGTNYILAAAEADIDNDGDMDIYLSRGKPYYQLAKKAFDFDPIQKRFDFNDDGEKGRTSLTFTSTGNIKIDGWDHTFRSTYKGDFPLFIGNARVQKTPKNVYDIVTISKAEAAGFPPIGQRTRNGIYLGYENGVWKYESFRDGNLFWEISNSFGGVNKVVSYNGESVPNKWNVNNKNLQDYLLVNTGSSFVNGSNNWNIPKGGNNWGVTTGDFNNDGFADFYVNRYPFLKKRVSDYMLINNGYGKFEITTTHGAEDSGNKSHGDMSQAFDYDLDGDVDILEGSDGLGRWHMFGNQRADRNNYVIVKVGYSPKDNVDPISADITIQTTSTTYYKRVGSSGSAHSQSLLNMVHFGLGNSSKIKKITVKWRNGETRIFNYPASNTIISTDWKDSAKLDAVNCSPISTTIPTTGNFNVNVSYTASQNRDIVVYLQNENTNTWVATGKTTVNKGSGNATVSIITSAKRFSGVNYSLRTSIRPVNTTWEKNTNACVKNNVTVSATNLVDNINCSTLNAKIPATGNFNINVSYTASQNRDIEVYLFNETTNTWLGTGKTTVSRGSGNATVSIISSAKRFSGVNYSLRASIRPVNTTWEKNTNACSKTWITVASAKQLNGIVNTNSAVKNITIFPNPSSDVITVSGMGESFYSAEIFTITGRSVIKREISNKNNTLDISNLNNGVYFIKLESNSKNQTKHVIRFVKK